MIKRERGFTLIELLITMVIFILVIAAGSQIFTGLLTQFKQQSKIAETNIEGIVGLEILRQDIEHAGYGLPWNLGGANYDEAIDDGNTIQNETNYNDAGATDAPPRAIVSGNGNGIGNSDVIVIKAANVARDVTAPKWTHLMAGDVKKTWTPDCENVNKNSDCTTNNTVRTIVISPGSTETNSHSLIVSSGAFFTRYSNTAGFAPTGSTDTYIIYGIDRDTDLRMPFNRADYYIRTPGAANFPDRCAIGTGILYKATVNHNGGGLSELPLLDCVADMQVIYGIDTDATIDGAINCYANNLADVLATVDAENIRNRIREVRVYVLAHEGQFDRSFIFNPPIAPSSIRVGEPSLNLPVGSCTGEAVLGWDFDLGGINNWQNYRWKVYTLVVKPNNLR